MCELLLDHRYSFILTCKYTSHRYLAEWIEQEKHWDGKKRLTWRYRFANGVPINDGEDALRVRRVCGSPSPRFAYHRTPRFGDSNWTDIISELRRIGYKGSINVEG